MIWYDFEFENWLLTQLKDGYQCEEAEARSRKDKLTAFEMVCAYEQYKLDKAK